MTYLEAEKEYGELQEIPKESDDEKMSWFSPIDSMGVTLFSFDNGKTLHNVFGGGKNSLTSKEIEIFRKENPDMAKLYLANKE